MTEQKLELLEKLCMLATQGIIYGHVVQSREVLVSIWATLDSKPFEMLIVANMCFRGACQTNNLELLKDAEEHGATLESANAQIGGSQPKCEDFFTDHTDSTLAAYVINKYGYGGTKPKPPSP